MIASIIVKLLTFAMVIIFIFGMLIIFTRCKSHECVESNSKDSVRIEVRTVYNNDTIYYPMPVSHDAIITKDSSSMLENKYAMSYASVKDGLLYHTLDLKEMDISIPIKIKTEYRDSIVYKDRIKTVYVNDKTSNKGRSVLFLLFVISLAIFALYRFKNKN